MRNDTDKIDYSVVKSQRGEIFRGSDSPLAYSAGTTAGDLWRAPNRLLLKTHLGAGVQKTKEKTPIAPKRAKNIYLSTFDGRPQDNPAISRALEHGSA